MSSYISLVRKTKKTDYSVNFPDFPGCVTAGKTLEEARLFAQEALNLHVRGMVEDGEKIPAPSSLDEIQADPENRDAVVLAVHVDTEKWKAVRINITVPENILERIDRVSRVQGKTRSGFLTDLARRYIQEAV